MVSLLTRPSFPPSLGGRCPPHTYNRLVPVIPALLPSSVVSSRFVKPCRILRHLHIWNVLESCRLKNKQKNPTEPLIPHCILLSLSFNIVSKIPHRLLTGSHSVTRIFWASKCRTASETQSCSQDLGFLVILSSENTVCVAEVKSVKHCFNELQFCSCDILLQSQLPFTPCE